MAVNPNSALKLSAWMAYHEPGLFRHLLVRTQKLRESPLGRSGQLGYLGLLGDVPLVEIGVDAATADIPQATSQAIDMAAFIPDLAEISIDAATADVSPATTDAIHQAIAAPSDFSSTPSDSSSSGFWSAIGSGVSNVAGAVGKVATGLLSPQAISGVSNAAASYFKAQAQNATTQAQQSALATQLARVSQGAAPAPITYSRDPITGALTPVYASPTGYTALTPTLAQQLAGTSGAGISPFVLLGGIGLLLFAVLASRRASTTS